jgi:sn-glycerol 3-phosphate transport system substrate-binding protein
MISLWHSLGNQPVLQKIVEDYNQTHPHAQVQLNFVNPQDYAAAARRALEALDSPPDMILAPEYMTGDLLQAQQEGKLCSVSALLDPERQQDIADLVARTFGPHCLPLNPACGVLYINQDLLEDPNWRPESFEDLIAMSRQIVQDGKSEYGFTCAWPEAYLVEMVLAQQDLSLLTPEGDYNFSQLASHIFDLWKLVQEKTFLPPATGNYDPTRTLFTAKKVAFYMQGSGHYALITTAAPFKVNCSPLPKLSLGQQKKYALPLGGAAIWVLNSSKMVDQVRTFLNYFASQEVQERWHVETAYVPVSRSLLPKLSQFYTTHPLHQAVVEQTVQAEIGENSFGIKKVGYADVRKQLYPLIRTLITQEGSEEDVTAKIREMVKEFDDQVNLSLLSKLR